MLANICFKGDAWPLLICTKFAHKYLVAFQPIPFWFGLQMFLKTPFPLCPQIYSIYKSNFHGVLGREIMEESLKSLRNYSLRQFVPLLQNPLSLLDFINCLYSDHFFQNQNGAIKLKELGPLATKKTMMMGPIVHVLAISNLKRSLGQNIKVSWVAENESGGLAGY